MKHFVLIILSVFPFLISPISAQNILNVSKLGTDTCSTGSIEYGKLTFNSYLANLTFESDSGNIIEQKVIREENPMGDEKFTYNVVLKSAKEQKIIIKDQNSPDYNLTVVNLEPGTCQVFYIDYGLQKPNPAGIANTTAVTSPTGITGTTITTGSLSVKTIPSAAVISINGGPALQWVTPFTLNDLPAGSLKVRLEKPDFATSDTAVTIVPGITSEINVTLKPKISPPKIGINTALEKEIKKHGRKKGFWLISTIISAGAGGYFMYQADQLYKEYRTSTDSDATQLHKAVDLYDKIGPACFGVAGLCALDFTIQSIKKGKDKKKLNLYMSGQGAKLSYTF
jgi:hypothetical protein